MYGSALCFAWLLSACRPAPEPERILALRAHSLPGCPAQQGTIQLAALGDFDASPLTAEVFDSQSSARDLEFPLDTRAVRAELTAGTQSWFGVGERLGDHVDLPLWRESGACTLFPVTGNPNYPGAAGGEAMGWSASQRVLLIAGEAIASSNAASAIAVNLKTGEAAAVPNGMVPSREYATVTAFGQDLLVAGGVNPSTDAVLASASVYETASGSFDRSQLVTLSSPRAHHAALVLDSGETLLIGGEDGSGAPLDTLEAISPVDRSARLTNLATLKAARIDPYAIRLTNDQILVAGGHDENGTPIDKLEWLTQTPSGIVKEQNVSSVPARIDQAFVAMPGGAALAVGGCEQRAPVPGEDCSACPEGCPPKKGFDAYWISPQGAAVRLAPLNVAAPEPLLIPASNGAPWLVASGHWLRFDPWQAKFVTPPVSPASAPSRDPRPIALDPGLFVWLKKRDPAHAVLRGLRFDTRDEYAFDLLPLLSSLAPEGAFPDSQLLHTAPDRALPAPGTDTGFEVGGVALDSNAALVVTDTSYLDLHLEIGVREGSVPPVVRLGTTELGATSCGWPEPKQKAPKGGWTLTVDRSGSKVTLGQDQKTRLCSIPTGRVSVALKAGGGTTIIQSLLVRREAQAP